MLLRAKRRKFAFIVLVPFIYVYFICLQNSEFGPLTGARIIISLVRAPHSMGILSKTVTTRINSFHIEIIEIIFAFLV
jgi:hypothetical protein